MELNAHPVREGLRVEQVDITYPWPCVRSDRYRTHYTGFVGQGGLERDL